MQYSPMGVQNFNAKKFQAKMDTQVNGGKGKGRGSMKAKNCVHTIQRLVKVTFG